MNVYDLLFVDHSGPVAVEDGRRQDVILIGADHDLWNMAKQKP